MKITHDGEWLEYTDDEGRYVDLGLFFTKVENDYNIGLDNFYNNSLTLERLKLLSEFLIEYVKKEESL